MEPENKTIADWICDELKRSQFVLIVKGPQKRELAEPPTLNVALTRLRNKEVKK